MRNTMNSLKLKHRFLIVLTALLMFCNMSVCAYAVEASVSHNELTPQAEEAAKLLGVYDEVRKFIKLKNSGRFETLDMDALRTELGIIRKVMSAGLELRSVSAKLDREITFETQAVDRLTRERDFVVAATNNANFLQLNIFATIIDGPLAQSANARTQMAGNNFNIVSGLMVGGLALLSLLEQRGGIRHGTAQTNMLAQPLGLNPPAEKQFSPMLWTYLNSVAPNSKHGLTRREQLIEYWKTAHVLPINIKKQSAIERVSVLGPHHHKWHESIKLINARIMMLFDLRAMVDLLNAGLVDLLQALN